MERPPQPWYGQRPPQQTVPGNPYAPEGYTPAPPPTPPAPARRRRLGGGPVIAGIVALLLLAGVGAYAVRSDRQGGADAPPVATGTAPPSGTPTASRTPAVRTPVPERIPTTGEINAGRGPGDATGWIVDDRTDLPRRNVWLHDLWIVGDTVVQAMYRKVVAHRLSDGAEVWSLPLPAPVCETPVHPTPDGKVVVVYKSSRARNGNRCNQLRMIDLRTGKAGWDKELTETGSGDDTIIVHTAISGGVLAIARSLKATAYRVADGAELYDIPVENPGGCYPGDVAGGARLLVVSDCAVGADRSRTYGQIREIDPGTGKVLWRHRTQQGWRVGKVLSTDPAVLTTFHAEEHTKNWRVVSLGPGGAPRTTIDAREKGFAYCADSGDAGEGVQNCPGTLVDRRAVYLGGTDRVGAYDLGTGKLLWGVKADEGDILHPIAAEGGTRALVYEVPRSGSPGGITRFGPGGVDTREQVLRHPAPARSAESGMLAGKLAYARGRIVITPSHVDGDDARHEARMLSFAPEGS
ncbi:PQQ-binding-like beta-propeller repeat protein [Streptomyces sp. NPDC013012]|uniref:outer membrane protein assembly factor BamB family protein n=1 Tax=Streptomyces sp. NPDC013012 TaxID=3364860 RepID=UPI0036AAACB0